MSQPWANKKAQRRELSPDERWAAEIAERVLDACHPQQRRAVESPHRFFTWLVGRGGGKTTAYRYRYLIDMARIPRGQFVYVAPTAVMAKDLLWDPFCENCEKLGIEYDAKFIDKTITFRRTRARLKFAGADDKTECAKLRGQPFNGVGVDEVASEIFSPKIVDWFVNRIIVPRLGERDGWLGLASTPGTILSGLFYDASRPGSGLHVPYDELAAHPDYDGWVSFAWNLKDVAESPGAEQKYPAVVANWDAALKTKAREQYSDENPIWQREYLGRWAADDTNSVFTYRAEKNQYEPERIAPLGLAKLPEHFTDWCHVIAMDEGAADPFACNVFALSPQDSTRTIYHRFGMEQGRSRRKEKETKKRDADAAEQVMYAERVAKLLLGDGPPFNHEKPGGVIGAIGAWPDAMVIDSGETFALELQRVYGLRCKRHDRSHQYKVEAINLVNGDLFDGRLKILKGSILEQQLTELQWAEDDNGNVRESKAQANHSSDCLVLARVAFRDMITAGTVDVADPDSKSGSQRGSAQAAVEPPPLPRSEPENTWNANLVPSTFDDGWGSF